MNWRHILRAAGLALLLPALAFAGLITQSGPRLFTSGGEEPGGDILIDGEEFTITGNGYGSRGDYGGAEDRLNFASLDFEEGIEDDGWAYNQGSGDADYWAWMSTGNRHARSSHWARRHSQDHPSNVQYIKKIQSMSSGKFFFSIWHYHTPGANGKVWRIWYDNRAEDLWMNHNPISYVINNDEPNGFLDSIEDDTFPTNTWTRMDVYMRNGGSGLLIDVWRLGINGNAPVYSTDFPAAFDNVNVESALGAGEDGPDSSVGWGYDDVYADFSPARVEICDTNTWAARAECEVQEPTAWADGEVTARARLGAFTSGETVYVYVLTDANVAIGPEKTMTVQ